MRERAMGGDLTIRKSNGVRLHHDKKGNGVTVHHKRKSDGGELTIRKRSMG